MCLNCVRIITKTPRRDHITEVLIDLHWLRIEDRIVYKRLILTFKAFIDRTAPLYLCELIEQQKSSTNTRTRLANDAFLLTNFNLFKSEIKTVLFLRYFNS